MVAKRLQNCVCCLVALSITVVVFGCARPAPPPQIKKETVKPAAAKEAHKESTKPKADIPAGLVGLSEADRELALKQKVCPVTGDVLGQHGKPIKITVKDQVVFLCCPACEEAIKKEPDKYLAKLKTPVSDAK